MSDTKIEKFVSQCTAESPCPGGVISPLCKMQDGVCTLCKRTITEIQNWETTSFEEREEICRNLLDRN